MDLQEIISDHKGFLEVPNGERVVCKLTGHSLPARKEAVLSYVNGKEFKKAIDKFEAEKLASAHSEYIQTSKNIPDTFFCTLTNRIFAKTLSNVRKHTAGKRFLAAKEAVESGGGVIFQEPDVSEDENEDMGSGAVEGNDKHAVPDVRNASNIRMNAGDNKRKQDDGHSIPVKKAK
mmetsp:Transcript_1543/g.9495  ORF Transcript_1543/g.9495 Transcript_1543/m.9495 type:complete len:176 (+) Transcript_1543:1920-2447(+)